MKLTKACVSVVAIVLAAGCGDDDDEQRPAGPACDFEAQTGCQEGKTCEQLANGEFGCFDPIHVQGMVFDTTNKAGIQGARVVARDANNVAVSTVAITDAAGNYDLQVPVPRVDKNGAPDPNRADVRLRADADGYLTFPKPPREALPVDLSAPTGSPQVVKNPLTDIGLIPLADTTGLGSVSGTVQSDEPVGTLVVAGAVTGVADLDGVYTVFNVPAGSVNVQGYKAGVNLKSASANVVAGQNTPGIDLAVIGAATAVVSGNVQIVNAPCGDQTSVILAVEETFKENAVLLNAGTGEAPPGLRVGPPLNPVKGAWSIPNVPDGRYVALAAFENDCLVRDPDLSIAGTDVIHFEVTGGNYPITDGFKVTEALAVISPDAGQVVSGNPTFTWEDDSSEDTYQIVVFDALGNQMGDVATIPGVSGSKNVTYTYPGTPPLVSGMYYQFRATSYDGSQTAISTTEDLKGVFLYQ